MRQEEEKHAIGTVLAVPRSNNVVVAPQKYYCWIDWIVCKRKMWNRLIFLVVFLASSANAFSTLPKSFRTSSLKMSESGNVEQIEFKIYPDGRVEETVRGIKGNNCHSVTEKINESLGEVVFSTPTEEMYEQELVVDQTVQNTQGTGDSSSGWEGSSTW